MQVSINGKVVTYKKLPSSYVGIQRNWKKGDVVELKLPMQTTIEHMPNLHEYVAIMHGPILLAAKTKTEQLNGLIADDSRWGHIAGGKKLPVDQAPIIIEDADRSVRDKIIPVKGKPMTFSFANEKIMYAEKLVLEPFFRIHDSRYMMYWMNLTSKQYVNYLDAAAGKETEKLALEKRTIDFVAPGEQQPEVDHAMRQENSRSGVFSDGFWRDAATGGFFVYNMSTQGLSDLFLNVRYHTAENAGKKFEIYIDEQLLKSVDQSNDGHTDGFYNEEYAIPLDFLKGKKQVSVRFSAPRGNTSRVYYVRLVTRK